MIFKRLSRPAALITLCGVLATITGCEENPNTDVKPSAEYGIWQVQYYTGLTAGLLMSSTDARTMCDYRGTGENTVFMTISGEATAVFRKQNSNSWTAPVQGRNVMFTNPPAGFNNHKEQKGDVNLYRKYDANYGVVNHGILITAGNENGVNVIPKRDFVTVSYNETKGLTQLTMNKPTDPDKRYIRIRTDYTGAEERYDSQGNVYLHPVFRTDLYQIDCGKSGHRIANPVMEQVAKEVPTEKLTGLAEESAFNFSAYKQ